MTGLVYIVLLNITGKQVVKPGWSWVATGPSAGIQLPSGRMLVCADHVQGNNLSTVAGSHSMWSDVKIDVLW